MTEFKVIKTTNPKVKPADESKLGFGKVFSDHMFIMNYTEGRGWHDGRIVPYGPIELDPAAVVLHYAQELFVGQKAFLGPDGEIHIFRPIENVRRMNNSCERICAPCVPEDVAMDAITTLVALDAGWIPKSPGTSLYIRPFMIGTEPFLGLHPSKTYLFIIILSPSGHYYPKGLTPTRIYVESEEVRATPGGTGFAKLGANYAISMHAQVKAGKKGYDQILWLDGVERKYVEEIGSSNAFFVIDGAVVTTPLLGTILPGVTRKSCIEILKDKGYKVEERRLSIDELIEAAEGGKLNEVFATGTAAVISPVGRLGYKDREFIINNNEIGGISQMLYDTITGIQKGGIPDKFGWILKL
jgi:branched-chain amino acid aminotransferase